MVTDERGTFKTLAKNLIQASFALPLTGGAVRQSLSASPSTPAIASFLARACTFTSKVTAPSCSLSIITRRCCFNDATCHQAKRPGFGRPIAQACSRWRPVQELAYLGSSFYAPKNLGRVLLFSGYTPDRPATRDPPTASSGLTDWAVLWTAPRDKQLSSFNHSGSIGAPYEHPIFSR